MGIPYLTKHLLPYAESVLLGDGPSCSDGPTRVSSVVIDGPSLVYHVYYRLLAWLEPDDDMLDIQPTCDEVSRGVMHFLLHLRERNVEMLEYPTPSLVFSSLTPSQTPNIVRRRIAYLKARHKIGANGKVPAPAGTISP